MQSEEVTGTEEAKTGATKMKISNSKKELAKIISENGGWRDGIRAVYGAKTKGVCFLSESAGYPEYNPTREEWVVLVAGIEAEFSSEPFANWHQIILSRAEYFHLYPAPDADGWIEWSGGERSPVGEADRIDIKLSDGDTLFDVDSDWDWGKDADGCNIIAYRLHNPEQAKPEFCESVMRSIPEYEIHSKNMDITQVDDINVVESKPTIEQLAADYRNLLDFAQRKQKEADDAKADAEAKLAALVAAGKEIGLVLSVEREWGAVTPIHPPLIAGDWRSWRQWEVGDFVSWSILGHIGDYKIIAVHHDESRSIGDFEIEDSLGGVYRAYGDECKFIRRP